MFDLDTIGWLLIGVLVAMIVVELQRWRSRRAQDSTTMPVDYAVTPMKQIGLLDSLSSREMQVAQMVIAGKRNTAIAEELNISINTVESHLKHIYTKLDVHNRVELTQKIRDLTE